MGSGAEPTAETVQRCARELLPRSTEIAAAVAEQVRARLPGLVPGGSPEAVDAVLESTEQNIGAILSTLAFGVPATAIEPPLGARKLLRHSVAGGADITQLLRAYRFGHELVWRHWSDHVGARVTGADQLHAVLAASSQHIFTFIDRSCEHLVDEHRAEFGGLRPPDASPTPADAVRQLLGDGPVDVTAASSVLGFDVRAHNVALVLAPIGAGGDTRDALRRLSEAASTAVLGLPVGDGSWWVWLGWPAPPDGPVLDRIVATRLSGVLAGMGAPARGRAGFRRSHGEAREAERTSRLCHRPASGVVRHRDIELAAVLCGDPDRARRLAADRLGGLRRRDETGERLRETLRVFLGSGCSKTRTAQALHVHHKTVSYRLAQAEELLGRAVTEDATELAAALLIDRTLHGR